MTRLFTYSTRADCGRSSPYDVTTTSSSWSASLRLIASRIALFGKPSPLSMVFPETDRPRCHRIRPPESSSIASETSFSCRSRHSFDLMTSIIPTSPPAHESSVERSASFRYPRLLRSSHIRLAE
jgi:hypothetical protein